MLTTKWKRVSSELPEPEVWALGHHKTHHLRNQTLQTPALGHEVINWRINVPEVVNSFKRGMKCSVLALIDWLLLTWTGAYCIVMILIQIELYNGLALWPPSETPYFKFELTPLLYNHLLSCVISVFSWGRPTYVRGWNILIWFIVLRCLLYTWLHLKYIPWCCIV